MVDESEIYGWRTPWGTLLLQAEQGRGEPTFHYPTWHSDSGGQSPPRPPAGLGEIRKRIAIRRTERWLQAQGLDAAEARLAEPSGSMLR
jgi:hypothetical protein